MMLFMMAHGNKSIPDSESCIWSTNSNSTAKDHKNPRKQQQVVGLLTWLTLQRSDEVFLHYFNS